MKDPAFLFYPEAFMVGTRKMSNEEVGLYIRALCEQFLEGGIEQDYYDELPPKVQKKFQKKGELFFNKRLKEEQQKREEYAKSRKKNGSKGGRPRKTQETISKAHENHMVFSDKPYENHTINKNINTNTNKDKDKNSISESSIRDPEAQAKLDAMRAKLQEANK